MPESISPSMPCRIPCSIPLASSPQRPVAILEPAKVLLPRPTVLRDTALQVEDCKEVEDGRGRWDGRGPVGARPPRWRRRVHARAPTAGVGAPQAGRGAEAV